MINIEDVAEMCYTPGSTHVMKTCVIDDSTYYLKFSDESLFEDVDPSLQILVEYLAYGIYSLYKGVHIPTPKLVVDKRNGMVGIATSAVAGKHAIGRLPMKKIGKMMSSGVYVDVLLANWDVIGTGDGNVMYDKDTDRIARIDPGGALTFRAQGGRKGQKFNAKAGELKTMMTGDQGAGEAFKHADLVVAAKEFLSVSWKQIEKKITDIADEISEQLISNGLEDLNDAWMADADEILKTLMGRHKEVSAHAKFALKG